MYSTPCFIAQTRSLRSFSVRLGIGSFVLGRLIPLRSLNTPPLTTLVKTSPLWTFVTVSSIAPSSRRMRSPLLTSFGMSLKLVETSREVPTTSRLVITNSAPAFSVTALPSCSSPVRILGPDRSTSTASGCFRRAAAALAAWIVLSCSAWEPCDMLMRTALSPALIIDSIVFLVLEDGPRVARILAFRISHDSKGGPCS